MDAINQKILLCRKCGSPAESDHNSFWCDKCKMLWPIGETVRAIQPEPGEVKK